MGRKSQSLLVLARVDTPGACLNAQILGRDAFEEGHGMAAHLGMSFLQGIGKHQRVVRRESVHLTYTDAYW